MSIDGNKKRLANLPTAFFVFSLRFYLDTGRTVSP